VQSKRVKFLPAVEAHFDGTLNPLFFRSEFEVELVMFNGDFFLQRIYRASPCPVICLLGENTQRGGKKEQKEKAYVFHVAVAQSLGVRGLDFLIRPSGSSPSVEATTAHTVASPVTFTTVLNISRILSGAMIKAIPVAGTPIDSNTIINMIRPAPGTPADPIDAKVAVNTIVNCCVRVSSIPNA